MNVCPPTLQFLYFILQTFLDPQNTFVKYDGSITTPDRNYVYATLTL